MAYFILIMNFKIILRQKRRHIIELVNIDNLLFVCLRRKFLSVF